MSTNPTWSSSFEFSCSYIAVQRTREPENRSHGTWTKPPSWSLPGLVSSGSIAKKISWGDPEENAAICRVEEDMATSLTNPNEQDEK